jgi:hypothetical protein
MGKSINPNNYFSQEDSLGAQFNSSLSNQTFEDIWSDVNFLTGERISSQDDNNLFNNNNNSYINSNTININNNNTFSSDRTFDDVWLRRSFVTGGNINDQELTDLWSDSDFLSDGNSTRSVSSSSSLNTSSRTSTSSSRDLSISSSTQASTNSRNFIQHPADQSS